MAGLVVVALVACGSDVGPDECEEGQPCGVGGLCTNGVCVVGDVLGDAAPTDTRVEDDVAALPDAAPSDTVVPPVDVVRRDVPPTDYQPGDLIPDHDGPIVVSISPADGEENVAPSFVIRVEFNERIRNTTVTNETFRVTDVAGATVRGTISFEPSAADAKIVLFQPTQAILRASPYEVEITTAIRDIEGNAMTTYAKARFFTEPPNVPSHYRALAEAYAPVLNQETTPGAAQYDYVTRIDLDGDWDATDNVRAIEQATSVQAHVYYSVVETKSHYFVTYLYYYPLRRVEDAASRVGNDLSGAQVVVQKFPEQKPVLVQVYSKAASQEDVLAYATTESGLAGTYVDQTFPESELFEGGHYTAYLSAGEHESCVFLDQDNRIPDPCVLPAAAVSSMPFMQYVFRGGEGQSITKAGGSFPTMSGDNPIGYGLEDVLTHLWPRRLEVVPNGALFEEQYAFESNTLQDGTSRPGKNLKVSSRFVNPVANANDYGRPAWAWGWRPTAGQFVDLARGTLFLDPAYLVKKRFPGIAEWNPQDKSGFSLDYCFHPYLNLDFRATDPENCDSEPN